MRERERREREGRWVGYRAFPSCTQAISQLLFLFSDLEWVVGLVQVCSSVPVKLLTKKEQKVLHVDEPRVEGEGLFFKRDRLLS